MRTTTQCPGCQAPVSVGEPACWSCGGGLARPAATGPTNPPRPRRPVAPGPYSRTCPACRETIALYHRSCPACGQTSAPPTVALRPPAGWTETLLPDGSVQLERSRGGRTQNVLAPLIFGGLMLFSGLGPLWDSRRGQVSLPPDAQLLLGICYGVVTLCMALLVAGSLAWQWAGRERWILRNGLLEIRRECLGRVWTRGYTPTELILQPADHGGLFHRNRVWKLLARGPSGEHLLTSTTLYGVEELFTLGAYLASRTGWCWSPPRDTLLSTGLLPR